MRPSRRRRARIAKRVLAGACALSLVLYFGAYSALHVKVPQPNGVDSVEYWYGSRRLSNHRRWRSFFDLAHRIDCVVWSDAWETRPRIDDVNDPLESPGRSVRTAERQMQMFSQDTSFDIDPADSRLPLPSFFNDGILPAVEQSRQ